MLFKCRWAGETGTWAAGRLRLVLTCVYQTKLLLVEPKICRGNHEIFESRSFRSNSDFDGHITRRVFSFGEGGHMVEEWLEKMKLWLWRRELQESMRRVAAGVQVDRRYERLSLLAIERSRCVISAKSSLECREQIVQLSHRDLRR